MNTSEEIDLLIQTKKWNELSPEERGRVEQLVGGEEAYDRLRVLFFAMEKSDTLNMRPSPDTLKALKRKFREHHRVANPLASVLSFKLPAFAAIMLMVILSVASWYVAKRSVQPEVTTITLEKTDTLFVTKRDTVTLTRVVYKTVYKDRPVVAAVEHDETDFVKSVNMQEKEELNNLLVSGTR